MSGTFQGQTVIITGGSNGIGEGIAKAFAKKGANVCIADVDAVKGEEVQRQINVEGGSAEFIQTDMRKEIEIIELIERVLRRFGRIDALVNNVGKSNFKPLFQLSLEEWDDIIHTNLRSVFIASKEAAKKMSLGGRIINIASTRATMSEPNSEAYAASKGGIVALTHALAASLQPKGITVNCISPGWIHTKDYQLREKDHLQHWSNRVGRPKDVAKACLYLADPDNDFVNGQNIIIDGGMIRKMIYEE